MTDTSGITHAYACPVFLSMQGRQHGVMAEAQTWKPGGLGLSLALSLWASAYFTVIWESWTNKFGTPSCSDTAQICKPETPGALVTTGSWDCQILTLWRIPFIVLKECLSGPNGGNLKNSKQWDSSISTRIGSRRGSGFAKTQNILHSGLLGKSSWHDGGRLSGYSWLASGNSQGEEVTWPGLLLELGILHSQCLG